MSVTDDIKRIIDSLKLEEGEKITTFFSADDLVIPDTTDNKGDSREGESYSSGITEPSKQGEGDGGEPDIKLGGDDPENEDENTDDEEGEDKNEKDGEEGDDKKNGNRKLRVGDKVRIKEGVDAGRIGVVDSVSPDGVLDIKVLKNE